MISDYPIITFKYPINYRIKMVIIEIKTAAVRLCLRKRITSLHSGNVKIRTSLRLSNR